MSFNDGALIPRGRVDGQGEPVVLLRPSAGQRLIKRRFQNRVVRDLKVPVIVGPVVVILVVRTVIVLVGAAIASVLIVTGLIPLGDI